MKSFEQNAVSENVDPVFDRRESPRTDVADRKIEVKFSSQIQFAKQYIDNISLGGLFVKTSMKAEIGEELPIQFSVPLSPNDDPQIFLLVARVARVDQDGLGLEFTELEDDARRVIEIFIKTVIPPGLNLTRNISAATFERYAERKETKKKIHDKRLKLLQRLVTVVSLLALNIAVGLSLFHSSSTPTVLQTQNYEIQGHKFKESDIRSISGSANTQLEIRLSNDVVIKLDIRDEAKLPPHIQRSMSIIRATDLARSPTASRTADPRRIRLR